MNITPVKTFVGRRERTGRGKSRQTRCRSPFIVSYPRIQLPHHGVSQLTAFITSSARISSYSCVFMVCNTFQGQFSFHHGISLLPPRPAAWWSSGGISRVIGAFSGIRLWAWCTSARNPVCLSYGALHVQPHHLSSSSPRPVRHRTACLIPGREIWRTFARQAPLAESEIPDDMVHQYPAPSSNSGTPDYYTVITDNRRAVRRGHPR